MFGAVWSQVNTYQFLLTFYLQRAVNLRKMNKIHRKKQKSNEHDFNAEIIIFCDAFFFSSFA